MILKRGQRGRRTAGTMVETAFIALVCFTFMFAIFEFGRVTMMRQIMQNAARSGARLAVVTATSYVSQATATAAVKQAVTDAMGNQTLQNLNIQIYQADTSGNNIGPWTSAPFGQNIVVQVQGDYPNLFPTFNLLPSSGTAPNSTHIIVQVMMRGEAN